MLRCAQTGFIIREIAYPVEVILTLDMFHQVRRFHRLITFSYMSRDTGNRTTEGTYILLVKVLVGNAKLHGGL
jgi:hypothetical protein